MKSKKSCSSMLFLRPHGLPGWIMLPNGCKKNFPWKKNDKIGDPEEYIYTFTGVRIFKKVYYFLMEYISGSETDHDFEMEEVKWANFDEAIALMGYDGAKEVLKKARMLLQT